MYVDKLHIYNFKCFGKTVIPFQFPGREGDQEELSRINNVNLILGDNGGGKSSVLRALAIAVLAPVLLESGFVSYRLVKRPGGRESLLKVDGILSTSDLRKANRDQSEIELLARIKSRHNSSLDQLHLDHTPDSPLEQMIYDSESHAFFVVGYGATRRVETGDYSPSALRKMRGDRYQRVAGLFEDHVPLRPIKDWFVPMPDVRKREAKRLINKILPEQISFSGRINPKEDQFDFTFNRRRMPFSALSDGYRAFIGWIGDFIGHLSDVTPAGKRLTDIPGIVLVDEVDLHLHPSWQLSVVTDIANAFPKIQFVFTSHSALIASSVERQNIFLTDHDKQGQAIVTQIEEHAFGRDIDNMLRSSYFGLNSTRPKSDVQKTEALMAKAVEGDPDAALEFLKQMSMGERITKSRKRIGRTSKKNAKKKRAKRTPAKNPTKKTASNRAGTKGTAAKKRTPKQPTNRRTIRKTRK